MTCSKVPPICHLKEGQSSKHNRERGSKQMVHKRHLGPISSRWIEIVVSAANPYCEPRKLLRRAGGAPPENVAECMIEFSHGPPPPYTHTHTYTHTPAPKHFVGLGGCSQGMKSALLCSEKIAQVLVKFGVGLTKVFSELL